MRLKLDDFIKSEHDGERKIGKINMPTEHDIVWIARCDKK
jgi:hypothetical protein